jgi:pyrroline-5-carboxylate reductase
MSRARAAQGAMAQTNMKIPGPLLLVGCGKMGSALLTGWLARGLAAREVYVVEPDSSARERVRSAHGVIAVAEPKELPVDLVPRAVVVAVKPQVMASVLPAYERRMGEDTVLLSIAAGTTIARFEAAFGADAAVVRAMPNTPAAIGRGVSALSANPRASEAQKALCFALMSAVGAAVWVADEEQMHAITALSGGAPAYVFLLIETLARAGMASGLSEELASRLARLSVVGSGALAGADDRPAATLRQDVTSPGGTTAAALAVLMDERDGVQPLFDRAIAAATRRSHELA